MGLIQSSHEAVFLGRAVGNTPPISSAIPFKKRKYSCARYLKTAESTQMRLLLRSLIASAIFTLAIAGTLFVPRLNGIAFMISPAIWLADRFLGRLIATSPSALTNVLRLLPFVLLLNALIYTGVFLVFSKLIQMARSMRTSAEGPATN